MVVPETQQMHRLQELHLPIWWCPAKTMVRLRGGSSAGSQLKIVGIALTTGRLPAV